MRRNQSWLTREDTTYHEVVTPDGVVTVTCGRNGTSVITYGADGTTEVATVRLLRTDRR